MRDEWLIALGIMVVVAILLDGVRRLRNARRDSLQMSLSMQRGMDRQELDEFGNEFPSGPARVVEQRRAYDDDDTSADEDEQEALDAADTVLLTDTGRRRGIDFDRVAPILMDVRDDERQQRIEPGFSTMDDEDLEASRFGSAREDDVADDDEEDVPPPRGVKNPTPVFDTAVTPLGLGESEILGKPRVFERPADQPPPRREPPVIKPSKPVIKAQEEKQKKAEPAPEQRPQQLALEDVVIISVMARDRAGFPGAALLEILLANGLRYGHRNIFHRYTGDEREDESLYSVVNAVKPGIFDLNNMQSFQTPGISLFLTLPSPGGHAMDAFDSMLATARAVADQLNGELRDDQRSVMTGQTIEHCRQRIRDFEMQSRLRAR